MRHVSMIGRLNDVSFLRDLARRVAGSHRAHATVFKATSDEFNPGALEGQSRPARRTNAHTYAPATESCGTISLALVPVAPVVSIIVWFPPNTYSHFIQRVTKPRSPARMICGALPHPQPWRSP